MHRGLIEFRKEVIETMVARVSGIPKKVGDEEIMTLPQARYPGEIRIVTDPAALRNAVDEIFTWDYVGFDTETRPNFRKGQRHKPALMQVAGPSLTYLFRLNMTGFHPSLRVLMNNKDLVKIGIALENDLPELSLYGEFAPAGLVDLNQLCPRLGFESIGARRFAALFLGLRLSKTQQTSNWENPVLTPAQAEYAACDAWVCREIYSRLMGIVSL